LIKLDSRLRGNDKSDLISVSLGRNLRGRDGKVKTAPSLFVTLDKFSPNRGYAIPGRINLSIFVLIFKPIRQFVLPSQGAGAFIRQAKNNRQYSSKELYTSIPLDINVHQR